MKTVEVPLCPICRQPSHATESDDEGRHYECAYVETMPLLECWECSKELEAIDAIRGTTDIDPGSGFPLCAKCAKERLCSDCGADMDEHDGRDRICPGRVECACCEGTGECRDCFNLAADPECSCFGSQLCLLCLGRKSNAPEVSDLWLEGRPEDAYAKARETDGDRYASKFDEITKKA